MSPEGDIIELLRAECAEAQRRSYRALIIQPGALGDCLLTLPLVNFMKETLKLGKVDMLSHTDYTGILPGRTALDSVISIDSLNMHRLYVQPAQYNPADRDPLINAFAGYAWIVSFLGEPGSNFEQNLIFTANCLHTTEIVTLPLKPPKKYSELIADYYIQQFIQQGSLTLQEQTVQTQDSLIKAAKIDIHKGSELLKEAGLDIRRGLFIIHPGSGGKSKCWHLDNFLAVAQKLRSQDFEVAFLLGPTELERFSRVEIKNIKNCAKCLTDFSLTEVLNILSCVAGYIGNDSGITHLAAMLGIKTLAIFGPTSPAVYLPIGPNVTVIQNKTSSFANRPSTRSQQKFWDAFLERV